MLMWRRTERIDDAVLCKEPASRDHASIPLSTKLEQDSKMCAKSLSGLIPKKYFTNLFNIEPYCNYLCTVFYPCISQIKSASCRIILCQNIFIFHYNYQLSVTRTHNLNLYHPINVHAFVHINCLIQFPIYIHLVIIFQRQAALYMYLVLIVQSGNL